MATSNIIYQGELRTEAVHLRSGKSIVTDAPVDNEGKGEAFSPTDLLATSLGNCMLTLMGIAAKRHCLNITGTRVSVTKVMAENPRRVSEIICDIKFPPLSLDEKQKKILENTAINCPVAKSLHPDIRQEIMFIYT